MKAKLKLGELLVEAGVIDEAQLSSALGEQRQWGKRLGMTLVRLGMVEEDTLVQTLASQMKLPVVKLSGKRVNPEVLARVPFDMATKHRCIPLLENDEGGQRVLYLGMEDPSDLAALDEISFRVGGTVKPVLVAPTELDEALERHDRWSDEAEDDSPETSGAESDDVDFSDDALGVAFAISPPEPVTQEASPTRAAPPEADRSQTAILRALSQLLVEKGIITRDEFVERVRVAMNEDSEPSS